MQTRHVRIQIRFQRDTYEVFRFYFFIFIFFIFKFMYLYVLTIMWLKKYFFLWNIWIMFIKWYFVSDCTRKTNRLARCLMLLRRLMNRLAFITEIPPSESSSSANIHIHVSAMQICNWKTVRFWFCWCCYKLQQQEKESNWIVNRYITRSLDKNCNRFERWTHFTLL